MSTLVSRNTQDWHNWAGDQRCTPERINRPSTVQEIVTLIGQAAERGGRIKAVGAGHSFTDIALTDGYLLELGNLSGLHSVDRVTGRATFAAGTRLHRIPALLAPYDLALTNMGDIDRQSIAGAISTGTHGTGLNFGGIATQVVGLTLVTGSGEILECSATRNPELFSAARVGLGALGIIVQVTLQCVPGFKLHAQERAEPLEQVLETLPKRMAEADHFEFYWFPHTEVALTKSNTRTALGQRTGPSRGARPLSRSQHLLDDVLVSNKLFAAICRGTNVFPGSIPTVNRMASKLTGNREYTDRSYKVFATERSVRFREMEFAVPFSELDTVLRELKAMIARRRFNVSFPIEVRCAAADDIPLSTASGRQTGYIAVHQYWRTDPFEFFKAAQEIFVAHQGRPHWGKWHFLQSTELAELYPAMEKFCRLRNSVDPGGVFTNDYLDRVLLSRSA
ncbi:D-arabinono-1,4-lactone oxidase [Psychromicrobium lacuslunae]|uniref:FAD-linked oxidoreductase n=1 Tax=Psychromicrobium lacuslunae TaxID=1618207 RepID=A0A0D4C1B3_9MICC|nr:D-arabinono-1,4-lactone oxidase [Psychromicrobium lacuslunae]AJT42482.1 FAD-linked oxidoreductase [Psychromicrobium lacuslunae]